MKIYITSGTFDYLKSIENKHAGETMLTMQDTEDALILHETEGSTLFKEPRKYEVIDSAGTLKESGFIVMNNIPVTDEGKPIFEYRFKNRPRMIEQEPGFIAIRVLRPLSSNTYIILTQWDSEADFNAWQSSKAYNQAHEKRGTEQGIDKQPNIFSSESYVTKYYIPKD